MHILEVKDELNNKQITAKLLNILLTENYINFNI